MASRSSSAWAWLAIHVFKSAGARSHRLRFCHLSVVIVSCLLRIVFVLSVAMERVGNEGSDGDDESNHAHFHESNQNFNFTHGDNRKRCFCVKWDTCEIGWDSGFLYFECLSNRVFCVLMQKRWGLTTDETGDLADFFFGRLSCLFVIRQQRVPCVTETGVGINADGESHWH